MDKNNKNKEKKYHPFLKLLVFIGLLGLAFFGVLQMDGGYQSQFDDSYKIQTKKNKKYDGIYSLTKLDENGKNTWDGLWLYVEKGEILVAVKYEMMTHEELIEKSGGEMYLSKKEYYDTEKPEQGFEELEYDSYVYLYLLNEKRRLNKEVCSTMHIDDTLFNIHEGERVITNVNKKKIFGVEQGRFQILLEEQRKELDFSKMYNDIKKCGINPSYDEDNNELWLSKLLNNPNSEYSGKDYKLIHHSSKSSINKCPYLDGECTIKNIKKYAKNK